MVIARMFAQHMFHPFHVPNISNPLLWMSGSFQAMNSSIHQWVSRWTKWTKWMKEGGKEGRKEGRKEWSQERTKDWMNQSINHAIFRNHPRFLPPKNPPTEMLNFPLASKAMWRRIRPPGNGPKSSCKWSAPSGLEFEKAPCIFFSQKHEFWPGKST